MDVRAEERHHHEEDDVGYDDDEEYDEDMDDDDYDGNAGDDIDGCFHAHDNLATILDDAIHMIDSSVSTLISVRLASSMGLAALTLLSKSGVVLVPLGEMEVGVSLGTSMPHQTIHC